MCRQGQYHVGVRAEGYSTRRTEVTVGTHAGDARSRDRLRPALRRSAVGQPERAAAVRVVSADDGAGRAGAGQESRGDDRRDAVGVAGRGHARVRPGPARPVIRGLDGDRVAVLEDGQRMGDLSSQSGDHGVPTNPAAAQADRSRARSGHAALRRQRHRRPRQRDHRFDSDREDAGRDGQRHAWISAATAARPAAPATSTSATASSRCTSAAPANRSGNYHTPDGEVDELRVAHGHGTGRRRRGPATSRTSAPATATTTPSTAFRSSKKAPISLTPKRHAFSAARRRRRTCDGWLQSYRATLGVRRYQHSELEGDEVGTTFHNDTVEGEVLLSHQPHRPLVGSFGGWFLDRAFEAMGAEALSPPVDQQADAGVPLRRS